MNRTSVCNVYTQVCEASTRDVFLLASCPPAHTAPALQEGKSAAWKDKAQSSLHLMVVMITPIPHSYSLNFFQKDGWKEKTWGKEGTWSKKERRGGGDKILLCNQSIFSGHIYTSHTHIKWHLETFEQLTGTTDFRVYMPKVKSIRERERHSMYVEVTTNYAVCYKNDLINLNHNR